MRTKGTLLGTTGLEDLPPLNFVTWRTSSTHEGQSKLCMPFSMATCMKPVAIWWWWGGGGAKLTRGTFCTRRHMQGGQRAQCIRKGLARTLGRKQFHSQVHLTCCYMYMYIRYWWLVAISLRVCFGLSL